MVKTLEELKEMKLKDITLSDLFLYEMYMEKENYVLRYSEGGCDASKELLR